MGSKGLKELEELGTLSERPTEYYVEEILCERYAQAGFKESHWFLKPIILSETKYMLHILDIIVEPDFVPLSDERPSERQEDENPDRHIPKSVRIAVWQRDMGRCVECGTRERLKYNHIIPKSKGGSSTEQNIQILCEKCNQKKAAAAIDR